jgi:hypothetical protein
MALPERVRGRVVDRCGIDAERGSVAIDLQLELARCIGLVGRDIDQFRQRLQLGEQPVRPAVEGQAANATGPQDLSSEMCGMSRQRPYKEAGPNNLSSVARARASKTQQRFLVLC